MKTNPLTNNKLITIILTLALLHIGILGQD